MLTGYVCLNGSRVKSGRFFKVFKGALENRGQLLRYQLALSLNKAVLVAIGASGSVLRFCLLLANLQGQKCQVSGVYRCTTHTSNTIPLAVGTIFPPCSLGTGHGTTWVLVYRA